MAQRSNREQLLAGAIECLKSKGYAATTARDIAATANANLASIGYHFGSKDALLNQALIRILEERNRHVGKLAGRDSDGTRLGILTATFRAAAGVFKAPRPLFVAFVEAIAHAQRDDELRAEMAAHYRSAIGDIGRALGPDLTPDEREAAAALLLALFDGLLLQRLLDDRATPSGDELLAALADLAAPAVDAAARRGARRAPRSRKRKEASR